MAFVNGGMINVSKGASGGSSSSDLTLADGLACFTGSFSGLSDGAITHGLNSTELIVEFKDELNNLLIPDTWSIFSPNVICVEFATPQQGDIVVVACVASGLAVAATGVLTVEGLSGVIDLDSPNGSIDITTSGQVINLNAIFTPASGAVLEQKCRDLITLSGLIGTGGGGSDAGQTSVNGLSGVVLLDSPDDTILIGNNGQTIELSGLFTQASGAVLQQHTQDLVDLSGLIEALEDVGQTSINGLSGALSVTSPDNSILIGDSAQTLELSGLFTQASGAILEQKCEDLISLSGIADGINERLVSLSGLTDGLPRTQTSIEGVSGVVALEALDGTMVITVDGQTIQLSGLYNPTSGQIVDQHSQDLLDLSGMLGGGDAGQTSINGISGAVTLVSPDNSVGISVDGQNISLTAEGSSSSSGTCSTHAFTPADGTAFTVIHGLNTEDFVWSLWRTDTVPNTTTIGNVAPSGLNHAVIDIGSPINGKVVIQGCASSGSRTDIIATRSQATDYTATFLDGAIFADASAAPMFVYIPNPSGHDGESLYVKKTDASNNSVTVSGVGSSIDLVASADIATQHNALRLTAHNGNWWIL